MVWTAIKVSFLLLPSVLEHENTDSRKPYLGSGVSLVVFKRVLIIPVSCFLSSLSSQPRVRPTYSPASSRLSLIPDRANPIIPSVFDVRKHWFLCIRPRINALLHGA